MCDLLGNEALNTLFNIQNCLIFTTASNKIWFFKSPLQLLYT